MQVRTAPILLLVYNREDHALTALEAVLAASPTRLFVAGDGPRNQEDRDAVERTRSGLLERIPEEVAVETLWREENLGCKRAVESAISWFFDQVPEGIIVEDDCVPHESFFHFSTAMLNRYREECAIMHVSGYAHHPDGTNSYHFDRVPAVWGWATWASAWSRYDPVVPRMTPPVRATLRGAFASRPELEYYADKFDAVARADLDSWAFAWTFAVVSHRGLCVRPDRNLVENIGIGEQATHTRRRFLGVKSNPATSIEPIPDPPQFLVPDHARERRFFRRSMRRPWYPILRTLRRVRQMTANG